MKKRTSNSNLLLSIVSLVLVLICIGYAATRADAKQGALNQPPEGFVALFNGKDLAGWKGLVGNPKTRLSMSRSELADAQAKADQDMRAHWKVVDGALCFEGKGHSLCTAKDYGDFEMLVDWKIEKGGDSGIYLRGTPQVQIWDTANRNVGAQVGSGGLYNNKKGRSDPLKLADRPVGQWNTFRIIMLGELVTVYLNDVLVVDNVVMENYWERDKPIYSVGQIELQSHGSQLYFRNVFIREIPRDKPAGRLRNEKISEGFVRLFNGKDLTGWKVPEGDNGHWKVIDGVIDYDAQSEAKGDKNLWTRESFEDFTLHIEWRFKRTTGLYAMPTILPDGSDKTDANGKVIKTLRPNADSGILLRGAGKSQINIWCWPIGSGEIWGYRRDQLMPPEVRAGAVPKVRADNPVGQWNAFDITMKGERVTVALNGKTVIDNTRLPGIPKSGPIALQHHGGLNKKTGEMSPASSLIQFRNICIRRLDEDEEGFVSLFNGEDLAGWTGNTVSYMAEDGKIVLDPKRGGGHLYTVGEYGDFILRFNFRLTPGANNGLAIRAPLSGDPAYKGMELQILDNTAPKYKNLRPYQFHGSIYGVVPAKRGYLKPLGEWNFEEVIARGSQITVKLNGTTIVDADISRVSDPKVIGAHPGLKRAKGHIGFCGHGDYLEFCNLRIKTLD